MVKKKEIKKSKKVSKKPKKQSVSQYVDEVKNNEYVFRETVRILRPDIYVLMDMIDKSRFNPLVLFQTIRHGTNIANGSKYGSITITIENGVVTFVRGEESTKLNELLIRPSVKR